MSGNRQWLIERRKEIAQSTCTTTNLLAKTKPDWSAFQSVEEYL
jgi:hypothetical protein